MKHLIYIAGPFFNERQISLIEEIEGVLETNGVDYFSPRMSEGSAELRELGPSRKRLRTIFENNIEQMNGATLCIAVLDWLCPEGEEIRTVHFSGTEGDSTRHGPSLNIPDSGTAFEIGYLFAQKIPVWGYSAREGFKPNLMLTETCAGQLSSPNDLRTFGRQLGGFKPVEGKYGGIEC